MINHKLEPNITKSSRYFTWGIEREALRMENGRLCETMLSPELLGTFPQGRILPDFSDTQVEFITHPSHSLEEAWENLRALHLEFFRHHPTETLWEKSLPPANLETWNNPGISGQLGEGAQAYREKLSKKYDLKTLMTSGVHINVGLPTESDVFHLARSLWRQMPLWALLFGNSPDPGHRLSRRLGRHGYQNSGCCLSFPSLESPGKYYGDLQRLVDAGCCNRLESASELYAPIRIKRTSHQDAQSPLGIPKNATYLEIRLVDLQGGPWGLDIQDIFLLEFLVSWATWSEDPIWNSTLQQESLDALFQVSKAGCLDGKTIVNHALWQSASQFLEIARNKGDSSHLEQGYQEMVRRIATLVRDQERQKSFHTPQIGVAQ